jgi:O-antigen/teichoic acid export membrane protein
MVSIFFRNLKINTKKVLRNTEQYTKTDMVYVVKSGFWSLFSQGVGTLSSFIIVVILANLLSKDLFGQYRFVLSIISILLLFTLPGIGTSLMRTIARGNNVDFSKIIKTKLNWGFIGSVATLIVAVYYFFQGNNNIAYAFILSTFFFPFVETYAIYASYLKGKQNFKTSAIYESISRIFQAIIIIITALIFRNILAILVAYFIGQIISRFFFYKKTVRDEKIETINENKDEDTIKYGKHLSAIQIISTITSNIDKLIVWHFLGAEILAIYYIALSIPKNFVLFFNIVPKVAFPKFSKNAWELYERIKIMRKLLIFFCILIVPALIYVILIPFVIPFIFKGYSACITTAVVLAFLIIFSPINTMINQILQSKKSVKKIIFLQILALFAFIIVFLIMYKIIGVSAVGAAIALVASEAVLFFAGVLLIK